MNIGDMVRVVVEEITGHALRGKTVSVRRNDRQIIVEPEIAVSFG